MRKVSCYAGEWGLGHLPAAIESILAGDEQVIAVAASTPPSGRHSARSAGSALLRLFQPARSVATIMEALQRRFGGAKYVSAHWRRGDRGHPEMGFKLWHWVWALPAHYACMLSRLVEQTGIRNVFVMTNAGRSEDREALRRYVKQWAGATLVFMQDLALPQAANIRADVPDNLKWERWNQYDVLVAEVLLSAHEDSAMFLSAGPNYQYSSTISQFVEELRLSRHHQESSTEYMRNCSRPHPDDLHVIISIKIDCSCGLPCVASVSVRGLGIAVQYVMLYNVASLHDGQVAHRGIHEITTIDITPAQDPDTVDVILDVDVPALDCASEEASRYSIWVQVMDKYNITADEREFVGMGRQVFFASPPGKR